MLISILDSPNPELEHIMSSVLEMEEALISRSYLEYDDDYLFMQ